MTNKKKILVIDDEETLREIVKFYLETTERYEVSGAASGREGLSMAKRNQPDLILLDIFMPEMSGNDVMEHLMDDIATRNIPVIFLTGVISKEDITTQGGVVGGRRFIAKPVVSEELIPVIDSVLQ